MKAVFAAAFALALDSIVTTAAVTATTQPHFAKVSLTSSLLLLSSFLSVLAVCVCVCLCVPLLSLSCFGMACLT